MIKITRINDKNRKGLNTDRDHKNDPNDEALISRLGVIEEVLINVKQGQRNGSARANESDDVQEDWNHFAAKF